MSWGSKMKPLTRQTKFRAVVSAIAALILAFTVVSPANAWAPDPNGDDGGYITNPAPRIPTPIPDEECGWTGFMTGDERYESWDAIEQTHVAETRQFAFSSDPSASMEGGCGFAREGSHRKVIVDTSPALWCDEASVITTTTETGDGSGTGSFNINLSGGELVSTYAGAFAYEDSPFMIHQVIDQTPCNGEPYRAEYDFDAPTWPYAACGDDTMVPWTVQSFVVSCVWFSGVTMFGDDGSYSRVDLTATAAFRRTNCDSSIDTDGDSVSDCAEYDHLTSAARVDSDADGVNDNLDQCGNVWGSLPNGCPDSTDVDTDGDSVPDYLDICPEERGTPLNGGCPDLDEPTDTDSDGIDDLVDRCPEVPGIPANDGCPPDEVCPADITANGVWLPPTVNEDRSRTVRWRVEVGNGTQPVTATVTGSLGDVHGVDAPVGGEATTDVTYAYHGWTEPSLEVTAADGTDCGIYEIPSILVDPVTYYAPTVVLHPNEKYLPSNPAKFVRDSTLRFYDKKMVPGCAAQLITDNPTLGRIGERATNPYRATGKKCTFPAVNGNPAEIAVTRDKPYGYALKLGPGDRIGSLGAPMFAEYIDDNRGHFIVYWLFYAYNAWNAGPIHEVHEGDWERVVVHLDDGNIASTAGFYQHYCEPDVRDIGTLDPALPAGAAPDNAHFRVYSALGGHASFPDSSSAAGSEYRNSCILQGEGGFDRTGVGRQWAPWSTMKVLNAQAQPWYGFGGSWGIRSDKSSLSAIDNWGPPGPGSLRDPIAP
ncbi:hypothetical protein ACFVAJ_18260 [Agromyces sp. NPDC057679]|uniref:hypothetical protein n=1 Tax=Agromyces sp. NPDC057679 TaxID=3346207 RepID=UPI003670CA5D